MTGVYFNHEYLFFFSKIPRLNGVKRKRNCQKKECDILAVPPLKRLNQKKLEILKDTALDKNALYLSPSASLDALFPTFRAMRCARFFIFRSPDRSTRYRPHIGFSSVCLVDAGEKSALFFLSAFTSLFLSGENAGEVSESDLGEHRRGRPRRPTACARRGNGI